MSFFTNNFLQKPDESVIGIDIGSSSLKIVQIKKEKGRAILETYGEISFGPYNNLSNGQIVILTPEQSAKIILDLLKQVNIVSVKGGMSIPLKLSLISLVDIPKVDAKEERSIIEFEARKYIPVSMSEVTLDYFIVPHSGDDSLEFIESDNYRGFETEVLKNRQKVLLVAIHNQVLDNYSKIVQNAKLNIDFFEVEAFATVRACIRAETLPVMIVDLGASSAKVYIIQNGILVSSHIINRGGQDISFTISKSLDISFERAESLKRSLGKAAIVEEPIIREIISLHENYVFSELKSVVATFQKTENTTISKIVLTGGSSLVDGFKDRLKQNFFCEVELATPFSKLESSESLQDTLKNTGTTFATAIGLALRAL